MFELEFELEQVFRNFQSSILTSIFCNVRKVLNRTNSEYSINLECLETPVFARKTGFFDQNFFELKKRIFLKNFQTSITELFRNSQKQKVQKIQSFPVTLSEKKMPKSSSEIISSVALSLFRISSHRFFQTNSYHNSYFLSHNTVNSPLHFTKSKVTHTLKFSIFGYHNNMPNFSVLGCRFMRLGFVCIFVFGHNDYTLQHF